MKKNTLYLFVLLIFIWIVLREEFSFVSVAVGAVISAGCLFMCRKLIPMSDTMPIKPIRLLIYFFYLIGQIYAAAFSAIRLIITGAHTEVVQIKTRTRGMFFRTLLANSVTIVPGSITLDLEDDIITVLWLVEKVPDSWRTENADELILGKLERMLIKAERE